MLDISRIQAITLGLDDALWPVWPTIHRAEERLQQSLQPLALSTAQLFANQQARQSLRDRVQTQWPAVVARPEFSAAGNDSPGADPERRGPWADR